MTLKRSLALAAAAVTLGLGGCISVFPKTPPAQLYRFDDAGDAPAPAGQAPAPAGARSAISVGRIAFDSAASTDRILTVTGRDAAYIAAARWVSPAPTLFEQALVRAMDRTPGAPQLVPRGLALAVLSLDVQSFETRYDQGPEAAPSVVVQVHAQLSRADTLALTGERTFLVRVPAADNRVGAIVQAYDEAVRQTLDQLIAWTEGAPPAAG